MCVCVSDNAHVYTSTVCGVCDGEDCRRVKKHDGDDMIYQKYCVGLVLDFWYATWRWRSSSNINSRLTQNTQNEMRISGQPQVALH